MRRHKTFPMWFALLYMISSVIIGFPSSSMAAAGGLDRSTDAAFNLSYHEDERSKIRSILEKKISDKQLLERINAKLFALSDEKIGLISSLCEPISHNSRSASANVAFLLITTLIIFS